MKKKDKLREMDKPTVLGYELDKVHLTPVRRQVDVGRVGDHGCDPVGDGTFLMVPSGEVVTFEEMRRRLRK